MTNITWLIEKTKRIGSKINEKKTEKGKKDKITFILNITEGYNL